MQYPLLSLSASAGSGKTYQLTKRYLYLLLLGAKPSNILTLTFTKKAAKEMEERITYNLEELYYNKFNKEYIKKLELIPINDNMQEQDWVAIADKIHHTYHEFLRQDLKITTIDAFFQKILKNFCWYVGVEYDFELQSENLDSICEIFLKRLEDSAFQNTINLCFSERQGLDSILDLCVFLDAFKESLKRELFVKNIMESQIDFETKALEYAQKIQSTYFDFSQKEAESLKFNDFKGLLDKGKTWLTKTTLQEYKGFSKVPFKQEDFERLKECVASALQKKESQYLRVLYTIFQHFLEAKEHYYRENNCLSFNAVASKVYTLLREDLISKDFLYFRLDSTLSHILIDEFQDTSILQYAILKPLIDEIKAGVGQKNFTRSFFYVGDVKQSIYRFRGGNPKLFKIASAGMEHSNLEFNYRSAINVVKFVNRTFQGIIEDFIPQTPMSKNIGFVSVKSYEKDTLYNGVLESLQELKALKIKDDAIAILVFDNKAVVELAQLLQEQNYKVVIDTSAKLINHNEVRAILELLKYIITQNILYKNAFFMLLGLECDSTFEVFLQSLQSSKTPAQLILKIMERYNIASLSAKKFLESTLEYSSITDLLENIQKQSLDIVSSDFSGIRIMTIHKSKGLEFENVLIVDKANRSNTQNYKVFFEFKENGVDIERIFQTSNPVRKSLDSVYKNALNKEKAEETKDLKHQLYVALTRAKTTMHILKLNQKGAFADLNLEDSTCGILETSSISPKITPQDFNTTTQNLEFNNIIKEKFSLENQGRQKDIQTSDSTQNLAGQNLKGIYYGIALHFAMEQKLKLRLNDTLLLEILNNKVGFYLDFKELEKIVLRSNLVLKNQNFIEIVAKGKVKCEIPFLSNGKQKRLDLLIVGEDSAWIVDYKSGVPDASHAIQVREYMESVRQMLKKETYGYVFYTREEQEGKLIEVT
ncbi:RecB-like helicase [Helicobacter turcicus]|uniref:DNA 3'-5' helicase n=1 Tax=Helicobacter turcicus TaxID=2867412 RepID=A0ABS7JKR3_9HELI|nr:RecB-like helicase [Helicobacter turcicus]MBX7489970.1 RecB-like helicase [Helicobacter turcicus]MBX7544829.1 RecB-like helicase [Helicobacter turcicus]